MHRSLKIGLLIFILAAIVSTASYCSAPFDSETAQIVNVKKSITGSGFILKKETLVNNLTNGVFEPLAKDGVRVASGSAVGVVISGNLSDSLSEKLNDVTRRIEEIKQSGSIADIYSSDEARIFSAMKELSSSVREKAAENDYASAAEEALRLSSLIKKKANGENASSEDMLLVSLEDEKYNLEQQLGGIREEILAPASGYFFTTLDGLEDIGGEKEIAALKASDINGFSERLKAFDMQDAAVAKITDTYAWYLAASVPEEDAQNLSVNAEVQLSVDESSPVKATVLAVNTDSSGEAAVILKCDRNIVGIYEKRTAEFEIRLEEYSGLYVPSAAIRVLDGITGVYVMNGTNSFDFKCVDVLFKDDDYYIVKNNYEPPTGSPFSALKIYDNILVNPEAVKIDIAGK